MADRGITVETDIQPEVHVTGDEQLLLSLIQNLVSNARKYGRENGHVWVCLRAEQNKVLLVVRDGGIGLGLSMVREIVKLHEGQISAESEPEKGSVFTVLLPNSF